MPVRLSNVDIQRLRLVNEDSPSSCLLQDILLRNFPDSLVQLLDVIRNTVYSLDAAIIRDDLVLVVNLGLQGSPVMEVAGFDAPHVVMQFSRRYSGTL